MASRQPLSHRPYNKILETGERDSLGDIQARVQRRLPICDPDNVRELANTLVQLPLDPHAVRCLLYTSDAADE